MANNISEDGMMDDLAAKGILHPSQGRNWRWVSRDADSDLVEIWGGEAMPDCDDWLYVGDGHYCMMSHSFFLALTGIDIQPGQCVKVEFTARVIEE